MSPFRSQPLREVAVGGLDVGGDHVRLHRDHEDAVRVLPGEEQVDRLDHLDDRAGRAAVEVVDEHDQRPLRRGDEVEHPLQVGLEQIEDAGPAPVVGRVDHLFGGRRDELGERRRWRRRQDAPQLGHRQHGDAAGTDHDQPRPHGRIDRQQAEPGDHRQQPAEAHGSTRSSTSG